METIVLLKYIFLFYSSALFVGYLFKDSINGQSPGKKIMYLKVISNTSNKSKSFQNFMRNLIGLIVCGDIVFAFTSLRRIGDIVSGTKIVNTRKDENTLPKTQN